ncbi:Molybdopterin-synthase adenylyltransferase MoeB [Sulfidibacter corallicola]|uniref:Molybdopterin-synthase adenylyltransferase n=1 Tax=Sulfidibacter corallicola TaxID=2818388 RepID=A0A8A4TE35_SULCO|nr:molybdopterin-synthase adenylyltransferase MoeB [Sulfidibacter corallicola]QTD48206.1 molybdopterin-synthase adenylyltransferase MoeB [Sulfidibacter corallicola]
MSQGRLSSDDIARYSRHLKLAGFGIAAQEKLLQSRVLLIGAGGLGCPAGLYLAAAGVGTLGLVDHDLVEIHNLQRQIAHQTEAAGTPKVRSLGRALAELNPTVDLELHQVQVDETNVADLVASYDLVIDGTDNYTTRYLVADACHLARKPLVYGAIHQFEAQLSVFEPGNGPCYRCLFPQPPDPSQTPSCNEAGVLGVLPGVIGVMMATEAIKFLTAVGTSMVGTLVLYSALDQSIRQVRLARDPSCPLCGDTPSIVSVRREVVPCSAAPTVPEISPEAARALIGTDALWLDVRERHEWDICRIDGAELLPLGQLAPERLDHLNRQNPLVVYCYKGGRSARAVALLRDLGFDEAVSLAGGIDAWADRIAPDMARY